VHTQKNL